MEHGWIRKAKSFSTACSLTCIYLQSNQNDHHGGQGYSHLDHFLARFVSLEWLRQIKVLLDYAESPEAENILNRITDTRISLEDDIWNLQFQVRDISNMPDNIWVVLYPIGSKDEVDYEVLNWSPVSPIPVMLGGGSKDFNLTTKIESREVI